MSPYKLIKLLNSRYGESYPTQMGYNYVRNGLIAASKDAEGKLQIDEEVAEAWLAKFAANNSLVEA